MGTRYDQSWDAWPNGVIMFYRIIIYIFISYILTILFAAYMGREYFAETGHGVKFEFVMILIMVIGLDIIRKFIKPN